MTAIAALTFFDDRPVHPGDDRPSRIDRALARFGPDRRDVRCFPGVALFRGLLRITPEVHGRAMVVAQASGKSLNQWVAELLESAVTADTFAAQHRHAPR